MSEKLNSKCMKKCLALVLSFSFAFHSPAQAAPAVSEARKIEFLRDVTSNVMVALSFNRVLSLKLLACLKDPEFVRSQFGFTANNSADYCAQELPATVQKLNDEHSVMKVYLALARPALQPHSFEEVDGANRDQATLINTQPEHLFRDLAPLEKLTSKETRAALSITAIDKALWTKEFEDRFAKLDAKVKASPLFEERKEREFKKFIYSKRRAQQFSYREKYLEVLNRYPPAGFISSPIDINSSRDREILVRIYSDIVQRSQKLQDSLLELQSRVELSKVITSEDRAAMLALMVHKPMVDAAHSNDPKKTDVRTALDGEFQTTEWIRIGIEIGAVIGAIAGCAIIFKMFTAGRIAALSTPVCTLATGLPFNLFFYYESDIRYQETWDFLFSSYDGQMVVGDMATLDSRKMDHVMNVLFVGVGTGVPGAVKLATPMAKSQAVVLRSRVIELIKKLK